MSDRTDMRRRQAVLYIPDPVFERVLRLPEGYEVQAVHDAYAFGGLGIIVRSPAFKPVPAGSLMPTVGVTMTTCETCRGPVLVDIHYPHDPLSPSITDETWAC